MDWQTLAEKLNRKVPPGSVTTYAEVSKWAYGIPNRNQPVRSLLTGAAHHGHVTLTNRVVRVSGELAEIPEGQEQQRAQLVSEGVPFAADGRVDFTRITAVVLA
jgi:alkylated DNA nucleotide flippase Atl1